MFYVSTYQINRLLLEDDTELDSDSSEYQSIIIEFRAFLSDCKDVLDEATTMKLLERFFSFIYFCLYLCPNMHFHLAVNLGKFYEVVLSLELAIMMEFSVVLKHQLEIKFVFVVKRLWHAISLISR